MKIIRIFKIFVAIGFFTVAYAFFTESAIFGVPAEIFLLIFSILAFIVLFLDYRIRQK